jgi:hypothetical protein
MSTTRTLTKDNAQTGYIASFIIHERMAKQNSQENMKNICHFLILQYLAKKKGAKILNAYKRNNS